MGVYNPPVPVFLTDTERAEWCAKKYTFQIIGLTSGDGQFGYGHTYQLRRIVPKTGEVQNVHITLKANTRRDIEADWFAGQLAENDEGVGPCRLEKFPTDKGNPAWGFVAAN